jgi:predicted nuclease of restriction endonuclease-like (RecB) superfamily
MSQQKPSRRITKVVPGIVPSTEADGYSELLQNIAAILEAARHSSARAVNAVMTATYWEIGRRIVEHEQGGENKADYGGQVVERLAADLKQRFGRGFSRRNVFQMRQFYLLWSEQGEIVQTLSAQFDGSPWLVNALRFPLPWSHYVRLMSVENPTARAFYEAEALRGGWSVRQLDRQVASLFYERTALSKNKAALLRKGEKPREGETLSPEEEIKDPLVLEFLGLKDEYSESDLEAALITHLEKFLLELGGDFAFIGRQRRLRVGDEWYRVDLLFYHRRLRCLVIIDLKLGKFSHADAGQMNLYLNYAREHWTHESENPPVGLILCTEKEAAVAHYALGGLDHIIAGQYKLALPDEKQLAAEIEKTRRALQA